MFWCCCFWGRFAVRYFDFHMHYREQKFLLERINMSQQAGESLVEKNVENYWARWNISNIIILNEPWKDFSWFSTDSVNGTRKCYSNQVSRKVITNIYRMNTITTHTQQTELHSSSPHSVCLQVFWSSSRGDYLVQSFAWSLHAAKY